MMITDIRCCTSPILNSCRFANPPQTELVNAAIEQQKITELRLRRTFGGDEAATAPPAAASAVGPADRRAGRLLAQLAPPAGLRFCFCVC